MFESMDQNNSTMLLLQFYTYNSQPLHMIIKGTQKNNLNEAYSKTCVNGHSQKDRQLVFKTNYHLMQVKSIAECPKGSILQYFRPSLGYHLSLRSLFCLFLSGCFTQVLLYV